MGLPQKGNEISEEEAVTPKGLDCVWKKMGGLSVHNLAVLLGLLHPPCSAPHRPVVAGGCCARTVLQWIQWARKTL